MIIFELGQNRVLHDMYIPKSEFGNELHKYMKNQMGAKLMNSLPMVRVRVGYKEKTNR